MKCRKGQTEVSQHINTCNECLTAVNEGKVDIDHFEIVQKARSDYEVQIREAFLIRKLKPEINKQMYQSGASYFVKFSPRSTFSKFYAQFSLDASHLYIENVLKYSYICLRLL